MEGEWMGGGSAAIRQRSVSASCAAVLSADVGRGMVLLPCRTRATAGIPIPIRTRPPRFGRPSPRLT
jgi:hypothetical protein